MPKRDARLGPGEARGGSSWLAPASLFLTLLVLGWVGTPAHRRPGTSEASDPAETWVWIDPAALAGGAVAAGWPAGIDERWACELEDVLEATEPFVVGDELALEDLRTRLLALSFVRDLPVLDADAETGLALDLDLREPVACLPVGPMYHTVDDEGVVLSGSWPTPVRIDGAPLPVIGPIEDAFGLFDAARPGDWLMEDEHLDALDVARSLTAHLDRGARRSLGRIVIDATRARDASVEEPGVRLLLEERRLVLFGRQPSCGEPGELAVASKWGAVEEALAHLDRGEPGFDWDVVDVRWDVPEYVLRGPALASLEPDAAAARPH